MIIRKNIGAGIVACVVHVIHVLHFVHWVHVVHKEVGSNPLRPQFQPRIGVKVVGSAFNELRSHLSMDFFKIIFPGLQSGKLGEILIQVIFLTWDCLSYAKGLFTLQRVCCDQQLTQWVAVKIEQFPINCNALHQLWSQQN